jgi:hypothetical protein
MDCDNDCGKSAQYLLFIQEIIECSHCEAPLYTKDFQLAICGKKCKALYWHIDEWKVTGNNVEADIFMEDSECDHCGQRNDPNAIFRGEKISQ